MIIRDILLSVQHTLGRPREGGDPCLGKDPAWRALQLISGFREDGPRLRGDDIENVAALQQSRAKRLQNKPAQIRILREIADMLLHIGGVDGDGLAAHVGGMK